MKLLTALSSVVLIGLSTSADASLIAPLDDRRTGAASWVVPDGDQFGTSQTHEFEAIIGAADCDRLVLSVTVGTKYWDITVSNRYSCHCVPSFTCETPFAAAWSQRYLHPFTLSFTDVSTSVEYQLLTQGNSPTPNGHHPLTYNIPKALDRLKVTSAVRVNLTFSAPPTLDFDTTYQWRTGDGYDCRTEPEHQFWQPTYTGVKSEVMTITAPRMGIRLTKQSEMPAFNTPEQKWILDRKRPFPSFELTLNSECCGVASPCPSTKMFTQGQDGVFKQAVTLPTVTSACCYSPDGFSCKCFNYSASVRFFENRRLYTNVFSFQQPNATYNLSDVDSATIAPDDVTALTQEGNTTTVSTTGDHGLQIKFTNYDIPRDFARYGNVSLLGPNFIPLPSPVVTGHHIVLGMTILQPFPLRDLWVKVTDGNGNVIFEEQEVHVPYVDKEETFGQVQWMSAIDHDPSVDESSQWDPTDYQPPLHSFGLTVEVKYNRLQTLGRTEKIRRTTQLVQWMQDMGSNWNKMNSPIPSTVAPEAMEQTYGVTASDSISNNNKWASISGNTVLTSEHAIAWYEATLIQKLDYNGSSFSELVANISGTSEPHGVERLLMTLFVVMRGTSPFDGTSSWFVFFDSFFPREPMHLPWFWSADTLQRMLGFSELPRMVEEKMAAWTAEYNLLGSILPWWKRDVSLAQWRNSRAWVMSTAMDNGTHYRLVPGLNLFHHASGTPNVQIITEANGDISLKNVQGSTINVNEEIFPDFAAGSFSKHDYLLTFGQVPDSSVDVATIPTTNLFLSSTTQSRTDIVNHFMTANGLTYKDALGHFLSLVGVKVGILPLNVDGFGSEPASYNMADKILTAERNVLIAQFADGTGEYATL